MSPFKILGIVSNASIEVANQAYRKLAMLHHPDRGGNESKFKEIKAAFEQIKGGFKDPVTRSSSFTYRSQPGWTPPQSPGNTWEDRSAKYGEFEHHSTSPPKGTDSEVVVVSTLREAFLGFNVVITRRNIPKCSVLIPPGIPDGYRGKFIASDGSIITLTLSIQTGNFRLRGLNEANNLFSAGLEIGDLEVTHEIDALDLITGAWIEITDFHNEKLTVRVPAGFNPIHRLKIVQKGYYLWLPEQQKPSLFRGNLYVRLQPIFKKPQDIDRQKIITLYNSIQDAS